MFKLELISFKLGLIATKYFDFDFYRNRNRWENKYHKIKIVPLLSLGNLDLILPLLNLLLEKIVYWLKSSTILLSIFNIRCLFFFIDNQILNNGIHLLFIILFGHFSWFNKKLLNIKPLSLIFCHFFTVAWIFFIFRLNSISESTGCNSSTLSLLLFPQDFDLAHVLNCITLLLSMIYCQNLILLETK